MTEFPSVRKVRIFVASPTDMSAERERVSKVVTRLNRSTARELGLVLEFTDWSTHVRPNMADRPEAVILEQLGVDTWDVFIGLLWLKFGSPPGAEDPVTRLPYGSGTQEEFTLAYRSWRSTKRPSIMMYRCERVPANLREIKATQLQQVEAFFSEFEAENATPGLYQTFREAEELEEHLYNHLSALLFEKTKAPPLIVDTTGVKGIFVTSQPYEVVALSVDIVKHSEMVRSHGVEKTRPVLKWLQQVAFRYCSAPDWAKVIWTPDGGIFVTSGATMHDRAVMAGIHILKDVELYNLNPANDIKFRIRAAASDGPLVWEENPAEISADVLNFTKHLEGSGTEPNGFSITDTVYRCLHESLKREFILRPRFEERRILGYRTQGAGEPLPKRAIPSLVAQASEELKALATRSVQEATAVVDTVYSQLEEFSRHFLPLDDRWSDHYIKEIDDWAETLLDAEKAFWVSVQAKCAPEAAGEHGAWRNVADIIGSKRAGAVVPLAEIKAHTQIALRRTAKPGTVAQPAPAPIEKNIETIAGLRITAEQAHKIRALVHADELQEEMALAELLATEREALIAGVSSDTLGELRESLLNRLWALSDLILIDELQDSRDGLFAALLKNPVTRVRYGALMRILRSAKPPAEAFARSQFTSKGLPFTTSDLHVVWRSAIVGVANPDKLILALWKVPVDVLWRTIASQKIRVSSLYAVAQRFKVERDDVRKLFFDCIHGRLMREVQTNGREFAFIGKLLSIFFADPLFVQSPYFERLDDLLLNLRQSPSNATVGVELFDSIAAKLKQVREDRGNPQATIPAGIESLPLPVQRHLASEGMYIDSFVMHTNVRIAKETERFVTMANVERIIGYRQINEHLLHSLLSKKEFFVRPSTLMVALRHPKCTLSFAHVHLPRLNAIALKRIAADTNANSAVRETVARLLKRR
jgi:hypothetical protein